MTEKIILDKDVAVSIVCGVANAYPYYNSKVEKFLREADFDEYDDSKGFVEAVGKLPLERIERLLLILSDY